MKQITRIALALLLGCLPITAVAAEQDSRKFTHISVHLELAPPEDVFKAIGDAGGVEFVPPGSWGKGNQIRLNFDLKNQPFWFGALQAAGFFGYNFDASSFSPADRRVRIFLSRPVHGPKMLLEPPLVIMMEISKTQATSLDLVTYADPTLKDWVFAGAPEITELTDSAGESLLPEKAATELATQIAAPAGLVSRHPVQLKRITPNIGSVKGSFVLIIAETIAPWIINNPAVALTQDRKIEGVTYTFTSLRKSGKQYQLKVHVKGPANGGFAAGAADLIVGSGSILATGPAGEPWRIADIKGDYKAKQATAIGDYDYTLTLVPEKGAAGEITSITWRIPTKMSNLEIPFSFSSTTLK